MIYFVALPLLLVELRMLQLDMLLQRPLGPIAAVTHLRTAGVLSLYLLRSSPHSFVYSSFLFVLYFILAFRLFLDPANPMQVGKLSLRYR